MNKLQRCFVCKESFQEQHFFYRGLCLKCGELNFAKRNQTAFAGVICFGDGSESENWVCCNFEVVESWCCCNLYYSFCSGCC